MKLLKDLDPKEKKIIVRLDLDVSIENNKVKDGFRIDAAIPTLQKIATAKKIYLIGHAGRPDGKVMEKLRLRPQAQYLAQKLKLDFKERPCKIYNHRYLLGDKIEILENLRFFAGEENNDFSFVKKLARLGEVFIFEAFAVSHRKHASVFGLSQILPTYFGLRCEKEMQVLNKLRQEAKKTIVLVGGAKIEDKAELIKNYPAQKILFGGLTAAEVWANKNEYQNKKFILPIDGIFEDSSIKNYADLEKIDLLKVRDLGPKTIVLYKKNIQKAGKNIIYAGPMGQFEKKEFSYATKELLIAGIKSRKKTFVLGGDSETAARSFNLENQISYISVGGGASLFYLVTGKIIFG